PPGSIRSKRRCSSISVTCSSTATSSFTGTEASMNHRKLARSRREFLTRAGSGFGAVALTYLLEADGVLPSLGAVERAAANPLAPQTPHHPPQAKAILWLLLEGGPNHDDLRDPTPQPETRAG